MASKFLEPSFFIIGERKCGTSSMYRYLLDHPDILPCKVKEPQFFSKPAWKRWLKYRHYKALFPLRYSREAIVLDWYILNDRGEIEQTKVQYHRSDPTKEITGEASANTFYEVPPNRLRNYYPRAKAILMLREPVSRAWSHFRMFGRFAREGRRLPFRIQGFHENVNIEIERYRAGERTYFVGQGVYADNLTDWQNIFGSHLYVVFAEELRDELKREQIMRDITAFLGVDSHDFSEVMRKEYNVARSESMKTETRQLLRDFYAPHNARLGTILKRELPWHE